MEGVHDGPHAPARSRERVRDLLCGDIPDPSLACGLAFLKFYLLCMLLPLCPSRSHLFTCLHFLFRYALPLYPLLSFDALISVWIVP
eukprot:6181286-Pleurochrysis_carterae.AAC.2